MEKRRIQQEKIKENPVGRRVVESSRKWTGAKEDPPMSYTLCNLYFMFIFYSLKESFPPRKSE
jgi:hypothetical protein